MRLSSVRKQAAVLNLFEIRTNAFEGMLSPTLTLCPASTCWPILTNELPTNDLQVRVVLCTLKPDYERVVRSSEKSLLSDLFSINFSKLGFSGRFLKPEIRGVEGFDEMLTKICIGLHEIMFQYLVPFILVYNLFRVTRSNNCRFGLKELCGHWVSQ